MLNPKSSLLCSQPSLDLFLAFWHWSLVTGIYYAGRISSSVASITGATKGHSRSTPIKDLFVFIKYKFSDKKLFLNTKTSPHMSGKSCGRTTYQQLAIFSRENIVRQISDKKGAPRFTVIAVLCSCTYLTLMDRRRPSSSEHLSLVYFQRVQCFSKTLYFLF